MTRPAQPDFAVLGGGLCGRLVAWRLAGQGHGVALYERGDAAGTQSAAWVAAAMLAPLAEAASAELLIPSKMNVIVNSRNTANTAPVVRSDATNM